MFFPARNLYDSFIQIRNFYRKALPQEVSMTQLACLASTPGIGVAFFGERYSMAFTARNIANKNAF